MSIYNPRDPRIETVKKSADQTWNNDNTLADVDDIEIELRSNSTYFILLFLMCDVKAASDFKWKFVAPAASTINIVTYSFAAGAWRKCTGAGQNIACNAGLESIFGLGEVITGATSGTFKLQAAQNTAVVEDTKVLANSSLVIFKV